MVIYYYPKKQFHNKKDTDRLIAKSLFAYGVKEPVSILRTKEGKPVVSKKGLFVGVTHTASLIMVAVAPYNFGIDAERQDRVLTSRDKLIRRFCNRAEQEALLKKTEAEKTGAFLTLWTKKEARLKYHGVGLSRLGEIEAMEEQGRFKIFNRGRYIITVYAETNKMNIKEKIARRVFFE